MISAVECGVGVIDGLVNCFDVKENKYCGGGVEPIPDSPLVW